MASKEGGFNIPINLVDASKIFSICLLWLAILLLKLAEFIPPRAHFSNEGWSVSA
jgi:hypothetical protein